MARINVILCFSVTEPIFQEITTLTLRWNECSTFEYISFKKITYFTSIFYGQV